MLSTETNPYRTTARIVGVVYVAGFVVGIGGENPHAIHPGDAHHLATLSPTA